MTLKTFFVWWQAERDTQAGSPLLCWTIIHSMPVCFLSAEDWVPVSHENNRHLPLGSACFWESPGHCGFILWSLIGPEPRRDTDFRICPGTGWLILFHCNLLTSWVLARLQSYFMQWTFFSNKPDIGCRNCLFWAVMVIFNDALKHVYINTLCTQCFYLFTSFSHLIYSNGFSSWNSSRLISILTLKNYSEDQVLQAAHTFNDGTPGRGSWISEFQASLVLRSNFQVS